MNGLLQPLRCLNVLNWTFLQHLLQDVWLWSNLNVFSLYSLILWVCFSQDAAFHRHLSCSLLFIQYLVYNNYSRLSIHISLKMKLGSSTSCENNLAFHVLLELMKNCQGVSKITILQTFPKPRCFLDQNYFRSPVLLVG